MLFVVYFFINFFTPSFGELISCPKEMKLEPVAVQNKVSAISLSRMLTPSEERGERQSFLSLDYEIHDSDGVLDHAVQTPRGALPITGREFLKTQSFRSNEGDLEFLITRATDSPLTIEQLELLTPFRFWCESSKINLEEDRKKRLAAIPPCSESLRLGSELFSTYHLFIHFLRSFELQRGSNLTVSEVSEPKVIINHFTTNGVSADIPANAVIEVSKAVHIPSDGVFRDLNIFDIRKNEQDLAPYLIQSIKMNALSGAKITNSTLRKKLGIELLCEPKVGSR